MSSGIQALSPTFDLLSMDRQVRRRVIRRRALKVAAWTGVAAIGLRKAGALGWIGVGVGLFALVRELLVWREERPEWRKAVSGEPDSLGRLLGSGRSDGVDRASATSFPASDATSHDGN
jgi:hypothetical protein